MSEIVNLPKLLSERQVAEALGVSVYTVQRLRKAGDIKAKRIGRQWKITETWLREYLAEEDNHCPAANDSRSGNTGCHEGRTARSGAEPGSTGTLDRRSALASAQATLSRRN